MDGAQVGVFEEGDEVGLSSLLEGKHSRRLESELLLELVGDLSDESLEGELPDEEIGGLLVLPDLSKGDCSWLESVGFLDSSGRGRLPGDLLCH